MPFTLVKSFPLLFYFSFIQHSYIIPVKTTSPLAVFSPLWNDAKYDVCNTAAKVSYMGAREKEVIYILNLARTNPLLFANTVVTQYPTYNNSDYLKSKSEYKSLLITLRKLNSMPILIPDSLCFESAECHAITSGQKGYTGHVRQNKNCLGKRKYSAECCDYGNETPLNIVVSLLIDEDVENLGHRSICLDDFKKIGVSVQPHQKYRINTVLDFCD
jgi:uncharacterized protein YkwD